MSGAFSCQLTDDKMNYEGVVTDVNEKMCTFELDGKITVHAAFAFVAKDVAIPSVSERVRLCNGLFKSPRTIFLHAGSEVCCANTFVSRHAKAFIGKFVEHFLCGGSDLVLLDILLTRLSPWFTADFLKARCTLYGDANDVVLSVFENYMSKLPASDEQISLNNSRFSEVEIRTPSDCGRTLVSHRIADGPEQSFGVYPSGDLECLVCHLYYDPDSSFVMAADAGRSLPCTVVCSDGPLADRLSHCMGKFVLVRKYHVFTEMQRNPTQTSLQYLYVDLRWVSVLDCSSPEPDEAGSSSRTFNFTVEVLHRASVTASRHCLRCWLHCKLLSRCRLNGAEVLLALTGVLMSHGPSIETGHLLDVRVPVANWDFIDKFQKLRGPTDPDIYRLLPGVPGFTLPRDARLSVRAQREVPAPLCSVPAAIEKLREGYAGTLSFVGLIQRKDFWDPLPSYGSSAALTFQCDTLGTPGLKTHQIFVGQTLSSPNTVGIYLNNWERMQCPLGLVHGMAVAIHRVKAQKGTYFKSTTMTRIQPLYYRPRVDFSTSFNQDPVDWGPDYYLARGHAIPTDILIWCSVENIKVRSLRISYQCRSCDLATSHGKVNCECGLSELAIKISMPMEVADEMGHSVVLCKSAKVLRFVLGMTQDEWDEIQQVFFHVKNVYFYGQNIRYLGKLRNGNDYDKMEGLLEMLLKLNNSRGFRGVQLKCRKLKCKVEDNDGWPLWFCVDARQNQNGD